jgi:multiple sugar transport system permease protein
MAAGLKVGPSSTAAPARHALAGRGRRHQKLRVGLTKFGIFGAPGLLIYGCFVLAPVVLAIGYSLTNYNPFSPPTEFVGLRNYELLLHDEEFLASLKVTTIITVIMVIALNVAGLGIALLLDRKGWFYTAWRGVFFVPVVLSSVVVSVVWTRLLADDGVVNQVLGWVGVAPVGWLSDDSFALYSLAGIQCWQILGFCVVVYLAGLQSVPQDLYEAAAIDGAGDFDRFRSITWPLLAPALTINTVVLLISAFKTYDTVQVITNGGPGTGTTATVAFVVLETGFDANRQGYATAMAIVMLLIIATASAIVLHFLRRREAKL